MTHEEHELHRQRHERIARVKRLLRRMPRRATMHRFPVLKWFSNSARKRSYLWCFRVKAVIPALYAGCILTFLPIYGIQVPLSIALAFLLRANLPVLVSLQLVSNPLTILPLYFSCYQIGKSILHLFSITTPVLNMAEMRTLVAAAEAGQWGLNLQYLLTVWGIISLGALVLGTFAASMASLAYRLAAYEVVVFNRKIRELQLKQRNSRDG